MLHSSKNEIAQAIFTVNRHAKTAPNPTFLYKLKKVSLEKLLQDGVAKKVGLHYSKNPKFSQQLSDLFVEIGDYHFHLPPTKEDLKTLPHLGQVEHYQRNPKTKMSLSYAKKILCTYTGMKEESTYSSYSHNRKTFQSTFPPTSFYKKKK